MKVWGLLSMAYLEERDRILSVLIDDRNGKEARDEMVALMMELSDIKAVAQSA